MEEAVGTLTCLRSLGVGDYRDVRATRQPAKQSSRSESHPLILELVAHAECLLLIWTSRIRTISDRVSDHGRTWRNRRRNQKESCAAGGVDASVTLMGGEAVLGDHSLSPPPDVTRPRW